MFNPRRVEQSPSPPRDVSSSGGDALRWQVQGRQERQPGQSPEDSSAVLRDQNTSIPESSSAFEYLSQVAIERLEEIAGEHPDEAAPPRAASPDLSPEQAKAMRAKDKYVLQTGDGKIHDVTLDGKRSVTQFALLWKQDSGSVGKVLRGERNQVGRLKLPEGVDPYPRKDRKRKGAPRADSPDLPRADSPDLPLEQAQRMRKENKYVLQGEDGKIHDVTLDGERSVTQFARQREQKLDQGSVSQVLRGEREQAGGFRLPEGIEPYPRSGTGEVVPRADSPDLSFERAQRMREENKYVLQGEDGKIHDVTLGGERSVADFAQKWGLHVAVVRQVLRGRRTHEKLKLPEGIEGYPSRGKQKEPRADSPGLSRVDSPNLSLEQARRMRAENKYVLQSGDGKIHDVTLDGERSVSQFARQRGQDPGSVAKLLRGERNRVGEQEEELKLPPGIERYPSQFKKGDK